MKLFEYFQHLGAFRTLIQTRDIANGAITPEKLSEEIHHAPVETTDIVDAAVTPEKLSKDVFDLIPSPFIILTQEEYDALQTIAKNVLYIIVEKKEEEPSEPVTTTWKFGDPFPIILT